MRAGEAPIKNLSAEIVSYIMDLAGPAASNRLSRTCKSFDASFKTHMLSKTYQVLNDFDLPPREFMRYLALTSSVIAGSVPANILAGDKFEPSDLDVITPASEEHSMQTVMEETIGFKLINIVVPGGMQGTLRRVYVYRHNGKHVRLWIATGENPIIPIMLTATTFVMNFITPWGIYCAYPSLTLRSRGIINRYTDSERGSHDSIDYQRTTDVLHKYISRGVAFETDDKKWPDLVRIHKCHRSPTCPHTLRSIGDGSGLHIPFPVEYEGFARHGPNSIVPTINQTTTWSIGGDFCTNSKLYVRAFSVSKPVCVKVNIYYLSQ